MRVSAVTSGGTSQATSLQQTAMLSQEVLANLRRAMEFAQSAQGKHVVGLIGPTGVGKTTILNHLLGKTLRVVQIAGAGRRIEVDGQAAGTISHSGTQSETFYAQTYVRPDQLAIVDCGGFYDTRGISSEVVVVNSMKLTFEAASSTKFALCCMHASISVDRASHLISMVRSLRSQQLNPSMLLLITRPVIEDINDPPTTASIIAELQYLRNGTQEQDVRAIFDFILRDNGRHVLLYDPLNVESRNQFNTLVAQLPPSQLNPTYSAQASLAILQQIVSIAERGNRLFNSLSINREAINAVNIQLERANARRNQSRGPIAQLNGGNFISPDALRQQLETLKTARVAALNQAQEELNAVRGQLDAVKREREEEDKKLLQYYQTGGRLGFGDPKKQVITDRMKSCDDRKPQLATKILEKENQVTRAQLPVAEINQQLETLTLHQRELANAENELALAQQRSAQLEQDKRGIIQQIEGERSNFQFLIDYKNLSRDPQLNRNDIQEFIDQYRRYRE